MIYSEIWICLRIVSRQNEINRFVNDFLCVLEKAKSKTSKELTRDDPEDDFFGTFEVEFSR